jgi:hypothetical protein
MRATALLAPLALAALAGCGDPLFSAEVVVDRFCYARRACEAAGVASPCLPPLPSVPASGQIPAGAFPVLAVPLELPPLLRDRGDVEIRLLEARIVPVSASTDLRGISSLDLSLEAGGATTSVASYARPSPAPATAPTLVLSGQRVDVIPLLQAGQMRVRVGGAYDAPQPASTWDADLELCFAGRALMPYF